MSIVYQEYDILNFFTFSLPVPVVVNLDPSPFSFIFLNHIEVSYIIIKS